MLHAAAKPVTPTVGPFTWADFVALPEDDRRELLDGFLVVADVATELHEWIAGYLITLLNIWSFANGGHALASSYKVKVSERRGIMPDVQFYRRGRKNPPQGLTEGAPDLAIEVVSESSRRTDRVTKLRYYQQIGTPEYWLVDPEEQSLMRFVRAETAEGPVWQTTHALTLEDGTFAPPSFAGLVVDLQRMLTVPE